MKHQARDGGELPTVLKAIKPINGAAQEVSSMKAMVVYDSIHGNTEKIARAIGAAIPGETEVIRSNEADPKRFTGADLLIIGSPTYGGRPTETMLALLGKTSGADVKGVKVATFDTRLGGRFVKLFGFAAEKIGTDLSGKGASVVGSPEGFIVKGREGPLIDGELDRAAAWARSLVK